MTALSRVGGALLALSSFTATAAGAPIFNSQGKEIGVILNDRPALGEAYGLLSIEDSGTAALLSNVGFESSDRLPTGSEPGFVDLIIGANALSHPYSPYVYFSGPACMGQAWVSASATHHRSDLRAAIVGVRAHLFLAAAESSRQVVRPASQWIAAECRPVTFAVSAYPAHDRGALRDQLFPPFHW